MYDYCCQKCDAHVELIVGSYRDADPPCPECGGSLARQVSGANARFVGMGFYANDYSGGAPQPAVTRAQSSGAVSAAGGRLRAPARPRRTNGFTNRNER